MSVRVDETTPSLQTIESLDPGLTATRAVDPVAIPTTTPVVASRTITPFAFASAHATLTAPFARTGASDPGARSAGVATGRARRAVPAGPRTSMVASVASLSADIGT